MRRKASFLALATLLAAFPAFAGTLTGVVRNGTTGKPAAQQDVVLISLQGGMEGIATARTDAQGRYSFDRPELGTAPMLVRVAYQGANYHQSVPPGTTTADIEIFESGAGLKDLQLISRLVIVQPDGATLLVGEEYTVDNRSKPALTFAKEFEFRIPEGAELNQVSAWGPAGMPVVQGTTTKERNHFGVPFPLRPGKSGFRISYQLPYAENRATVAAPSLYPVDTVFVIAPPTMQVAAAGFSPAGTEQGFNVYSHPSVAANAALDVAVSGTAPPPQSGGESASAEDADSGTRLQTMPPRLENLQWILLGGLLVIFALGTVLLWKKPSAVAVPAVATAGAPSPAVRPASSAGAAAAELDRAVNRSLDEIKDALLRLELRRQAGTLTEEEYARQRAPIEQTLRELVKG